MSKTTTKTDKLDNSSKISRQSKSTNKSQEFAIKDQDFESAIQNLENIINKMESGKLSLADSLKSFEEGIALTNHCQSLLSNAEQKVQILIKEQETKFKDFVLDDQDEDPEDFEDKSDD